MSEEYCRNFFLKKKACALGLCLKRNYFIEQIIITTTLIRELYLRLYILLMFKFTIYTHAR